MDKVNEHPELIKPKVIDKIIEDLEDDDENGEIYKWLSIAVGVIWILSFVFF
jgi:hypothetical protein